MSDSEPSLTRQYVKLCDLPDFEDGSLRARIDEIVPGLEEPAHLQRKYWEYGMLTLFLEDVGRLGQDVEVLSVGAGHEEVLYWLANRVRRVVATDIYGEGGFAGAGAEADGLMLTNPQAYAPYSYRADHLDVLRMDGRSLEFRNDSFDVVFSLSSIEHFGSGADVSRAAAEIGRVLRPDGYAFIVTECFVDRSILNSKVLQTSLRAATLGRRCQEATPWRRAVDVFTPGELVSRIVRPSGLELMQPLDLTVSPGTRRNIIRWYGEGRFEPTAKPWPHILLQPQGSAFFLRGGGAPFTSVALALRKPPNSARL
jgi:SAM-dependent methyltransferase